MDQDLLSIPQRGAWHILQANGCRQAHKLFVFEIYESYESFGEFGKTRYYIVGDSKRANDDEGTVRLLLRLHFIRGLLHQNVP